MIPFPKRVLEILRYQEYRRQNKLPTQVQIKRKQIMFDWLYRLLGSMLSFFESFTKSYALALLLYALVFKLLLVFFSIKQQKNQIAMAKLSPKIQLIKAKYKGRTDQPTMQKQQQEIMELQQKEGVSPFSGCLPLIFQMIIIMLVYTVIQNPLSYIAKTTDDEKFEMSEVILAVYEDLPARIEADTEYVSETKTFDANSTSAEYTIKYKNSGTFTFTKIENGSGKDTTATLKYTTKDGVEETITIKTNESIHLDKLSNGSYTVVIDKRPDQNISDYTIEFSYLEDLTSMPSNHEIKMIGYINQYVSSAIDESDRAKKIADIESKGLDYESIPNFNFFGLDLTNQPSFTDPSWILIIPFTAAAAQWVSMWLSRKFNGNSAQMQMQDSQTAASMKTMDIVLPLITIFFTFSTSAMLGLYWIYQSILGVAQSFIIAKAMPLPKFTEEEIKEMHKAQKEIEKAQKAAAKAQPKHRSLHYIDDDDYDTLPEAPKSEETKGSSTDMGGNIPEIKD